MSKVYDETYFNRWYRGAQPAADRAHLRRKVAMAVAMAEYYLERPIRSVLDIGCGEGAWRAPLLKLRPKVEYLGFDSSEYAVRRYGRTRNLHLARFGDFAWLRPCAPVDLLVCSDVMHYVPDRELRAGLAGVAELVLFDAANPRSLVYQLERLRVHLRGLPQVLDVSRMYAHRFKAL